MWQFLVRKEVYSTLSAVNGENTVLRAVGEVLKPVGGSLAESPFVPGTVLPRASTLKGCSCGESFQLSEQAVKCS